MLQSLHFEHGKSLPLLTTDFPKEYWSLEWKAVPSLSGVFCSETGLIAVRDLRSGRWRVTRGYVGRRGYYVVGLFGRMWRCSRLVAAAFYGAPPFEGVEAVHLNGDPSDNRSSNLAWLSHQDSCSRDVFRSRCSVWQKGFRKPSPIHRFRAALSGSRRKVWSRRRSAQA